MVGKELVVSNDRPMDLHVLRAQTTLLGVRKKGHAYVELRRVGKRVIFFCTICLTPCFSDTVLFDHLSGRLHSQRLSAAKVTLFGPTPWPFNDGMLFFTNSREKSLLFWDQTLPSNALNVKSHVKENDNEVTSRLRDGSKSPDIESTLTGNNKALVAVNEHDTVKTIVNAPDADHDALVISSLLLNNTVTNVIVDRLGYGKISCKVSKDNGTGRSISKIWCAWISADSTDVSNEVSHHCDVAVVNFSYAHSLGRKWSTDGVDPLSSGTYFLIDDSGQRVKKVRKSFSDQEASSDDINGHSSSLVEDGQVSKVRRIGPSEQSMHRHLSIIPAQSVRHVLRKQKLLTTERACDICGHQMLNKKDVATLLNCKTGKLACSSRNGNGAYHLFHVSCLIHWILLCKHEILDDQWNRRKGTRGRKPKAAAKNRLSAVMCPECQGTGVRPKNGEFEKPSISLAQMFTYKIKAIEAHKAWMKKPECLDHCSTGLCFSPEYLGNREEVVSLEELRFYRADD